MVVAVFADYTVVKMAFQIQFNLRLFMTIWAASTISIVIVDVERNHSEQENLEKYQNFESKLIFHEKALSLIIAVYL